MKKVVSLAVVMAIVALDVALAAAQAQQPSKAPQPARSQTEEILTAWNSIGRKLVAMAEDFPEDKYDFKPNPSQRSFAEQLLHVAGSNYSFINVGKGQEPPKEEDLPRAKYKTKADVVAAVKKSFADGAAVIKEKGDAGMAQTVKFAYANRMIYIWAFAMAMIEHAGEHYGQLVVYYRVNNMVPPESRPRK